MKKKLIILFCFILFCSLFSLANFDNDSEKKGIWIIQKNSEKIIHDVQSRGEIADDSLFNNFEIFKYTGDSVIFYSFKIGFIIAKAVWKSSVLNANVINKELQINMLLPIADFDNKNQKFKGIKPNYHLTKHFNKLDEKEAMVKFPSLFVPKEWSFKP